MSFPASPVLNEIFIANGKAWKFDGTNWVIPQKASTIPWELVTGKPDYFPAKVIYSVAPPANAVVGTAWWDQNNSVLYVYDGSAWVENSQTFRTGDLDAWDYIYRVQAADGQDLEDSVIAAMLKFVIGCKTDGIWDAIKASCVMAGARTLNGALVPLKGAAPTNFNFESTDYNRKTGLKGDGATKYLNANRANNADPQNSHHQSVWVSEHSAGTASYINAGNTATGSTSIVKTTTSYAPRSRNSQNDTVGFSNFLPGLVALSRDNAANYTLRYQSNQSVITRSSQAPTNAPTEIYRRPDATTYADARFAFYSIGEAINMPQLDARVFGLLTDLNIAIP